MVREVKYIPDSREELDETIRALEAAGVKRNAGETQENFTRRIVDRLYGDLRDPLNAAQDLVGGDYREHPEVSMLCIRLQAIAKEKMAKVRKDTYYNMAWKDFTELVEERGFQKVASYPFIIDRLEGVQECGLWMDFEHAMLLIGDSFGYEGYERTLNSAYLHCEASAGANLNAISDEAYERFHDAFLPHTRHETFKGRPRSVEERNDTSVVCLYDDVREGLFEWRQRLLDMPYEVVNPWQRFSNHRLGLYHYGDDSRDRKTITKKRIEALSNTTKKVLGIL